MALCGAHQEYMRSVASERNAAEKLAESLQNKWASRDLMIEKLSSEVSRQKAAIERSLQACESVMLHSSHQSSRDTVEMIAGILRYATVSEGKSFKHCMYCKVREGMEHTQDCPEHPDSVSEGQNDPLEEILKDTPFRMR